MTRAAAISVALLLSATPAPAQDAAALLGLGLCKNIKTDAERLKCFDRAAGPLASPSPADKPKIDPSDLRWHVTEGKSPIDDSVQYSAMLFSTSGGGTLSMRCRGTETDATVTSDGFMNSRNNIKVIYRIDNEKAQEALWSPSATGRTAYVASPIGFLRQIPDGARLLIRLHDYQGVPHDAIYNVGSISAQRKRLGEVCNWLPNLRN